MKRDFDRLWTGIAIGVPLLNIFSRYCEAFWFRLQFRKILALYGHRDFKQEKAAPTMVDLRYRRIAADRSGTFGGTGLQRAQPHSGHLLAGQDVCI